MPTTRYLWDDETDTVVMELDETGATKAVYNSDPVPYGRLFSMRRDGTTYDYRYDAQGNTRALTDETGQVTDTYRYDAWGVPTAQSGTTENPYRYGGRVGYQYDEATGDYYVRARTYEPERARWRSKDPFRELPWNLYQFVSNNPIGGSDPSGMFATGIPGDGTLANLAFILPRIGGYAFKRVECPKACQPLYWRFCGFTFMVMYWRGPSGAVSDFSLMLAMGPGVIPPGDPLAPPQEGVITAEQRVACCQSDIDRTIGEGDHITVKTLDGSVCKFTKNEFPEGGFGLDKEKVKTNLGKQCNGVLKSSALPVKFYKDPAVGSPQGAVYTAAVPLQWVELDFNLHVHCGCGGYNPDGTLKTANRESLQMKVRLP